jgi:Protein of unknown function (DUF1376)
MTDQLPPPLVSTKVDLTDFKFMPLEVARLRRSKAWLICKRRPEVAFYMLNLWTASWHERPASSLEDDDDVLADAAMCPPDRWSEVKADVLRGWIKCSDGRLYHPVVAEKALEAWNGKLMKRWQNECDRLRKENKRREASGEDSLPLPPKPERNSVSAAAEIQKTSGGIPAENALKGQGQGQGQGQGEDTGLPPADPEIVTAFKAWNELASRHSRWPKAKDLTIARRNALQARLRDVGSVAEFRTVLARAEASQFIRKKMKGWSLDWFLKKANFAKVREGNYNDYDDSSDDTVRSPDDVIAQHEREGAWDGVEI